jgi:hypothetical protein
MPSFQIPTFLLHFAPWPLLVLHDFNSFSHQQHLVSLSLPSRSFQIAFLVRKLFVSPKARLLMLFSEHLETSASVREHKNLIDFHFNSFRIQFPTKVFFLLVAMCFAIKSNSKIEFIISKPSTFWARATWLRSLQAIKFLLPQSKCL